MKVQTVKRFYDREAEKIRETGEIFDVTSDRASAINSTTFGKLVEIVESAEEAEAPMSVKDIKAALDARGIEYRGNAKKEELLKLL